MRLRNVSVLTVLLFGLSGLVSLSWYTAFSSSRGKPGPGGGEEEEEEISLPGASSSPLEDEELVVVM